MIYTVTFNPALDYVMHTGTLINGKTNRSQTEELYFGGKGINVSYVLSQLGVSTTALGFVAGFTGDALEAAVKDWGIKTDFVHLANGLTRINVKLKGECETEINAQGPSIDKDALDALFLKLDVIKNGDTLVLAGSVPSSLPSDIYESILKRLSGRGVRFVVDATGKLLENTLQFKPFLIKPNIDELCEVLNIKIEAEEELIAAAKRLQEKGAQNVLVSLGGDGAVLLADDGKIYKKPACKGTPVNTVGCGDSMLAGFLAGYQKGAEHALALAVAAGGATAFKSWLAEKEEIMNLL
ncbi:MAG: 1-phosphofructokinase [Acutalibacteraceae bacterium]|nr:1-phosphofructokinase [Acutalibacteraceae bacterium]